jgi:hypothetical protein
VHIPNPLVHLIKQADGLQGRGIGFYGKFMPVQKHNIWVCKPRHKRLAANLSERCIDCARMYPPGFAVYITLGATNSLEKIMEKTRQVLAFLMLIVAPSLSVAGYSVDVYFQFQRLAVGSGTVSEDARHAIQSYEQGIAEAYRVVAEMNGNSIPIDGKPKVCLVSSDAISQQVVSAAIARVIGTAQNPKDPQNWKNDLVAVPALIGLAQIFPCKN